MLLIVDGKGIELGALWPSLMKSSIAQSLTKSCVKTDTTLKYDTRGQPSVIFSQAAAICPYGQLWPFQFFRGERTLLPRGGGGWGVLCPKDLE